MTTLYQVRPFRMPPRESAPVVAVVTSPEAAQAVANLMGVVCSALPVPAVEVPPKRKGCLICDPLEIDWGRWPFMMPITYPPRSILLINHEGI